MCILITSTLHPDYPLIVLSNRDEYFNRPTQLATKRSIGADHKILSPVDLGREERGTWIGLTSSGKLAVLLNYRENTDGFSEVSRGVLPIEYLSSELNDEEWLEAFSESQRLSSIGGFSLIYGKLQLDPKTHKLRHLNIMSNRGDRGKIHAQEAISDDLHRNISQKPTFAVSNSLYYHPWQKARLGIDHLSKLIEESVEKSLAIEELKNRCFDILSLNTYSSEVLEKGTAREKLEELQNSIFIPALHMAPNLNHKNASMEYGTRTQTVVILDKKGKLTYYERDVHSISGEQRYRFNLQNIFGQ